MGTEIGGLLEVRRVHVTFGILLFLIKDVFLGVSLLGLLFASGRTKGGVILVGIGHPSADH